MPIVAGSAAYQLNTWTCLLKQCLAWFLVWNRPTWRRAGTQVTVHCLQRWLPTKCFMLLSRFLCRLLFIHTLIIIVIKTCEAGLVLSVARILRAAFSEFRVCVCMYVCMSNVLLPNHWTDLHKITPSNRVSYADCYRLLRFEIFTEYDEYCPRERCRLHRRIFTNGNVLRGVIVVISVTIGVFRNNWDWPTKKPRQSEINFIRLLT